jgi:hypothetical protein
MVLTEINYFIGVGLPKKFSCKLKTLSSVVTFPTPVTAKTQGEYNTLPLIIEFHFLPSLPCFVPWEAEPESCTIQVPLQLGFWLGEAHGRLVLARYLKREGPRLDRCLPPGYGQK